MACGKKSNNAPTEEFILESPAPVDVAAKISAIYRELSEKVINATNCTGLASITIIKMQVAQGMEKLITFCNLGKRTGSGFDSSGQILRKHLQRSC